MGARAPYILAADDGGSLAFTGFNVLLLVILGIPLMLTGLVTRASLRARRPPA
jgi:hypothetical protein